MLEVVEQLELAAGLPSRRSAGKTGVDEQRVIVD